jgi:hypothetical protein
MCGWAILSTSARRAEALFCSRGAPGGAAQCWNRRRRFWRCCTRWQRCIRHGRSCGCTQLAIGSIIPRLRSSRLMLALTHGRNYVCYSRPARKTKWARISTRMVTCRDRFSTRPAFPPEADVYLCGPNRFMADMKETPATRGGADSRRNLQRQRVDHSWRRRHRDACSAPAQG